jgi:hypothetical protein
MKKILSLPPVENFFYLWVDGKLLHITTERKQGANAPVDYFSLSLFGLILAITRYVLCHLWRQHAVLHQRLLITH